MSGRLVILPHKSWNFWNQDNREKVARDERLHKEAEDAKIEKERQLQQEQNLEILRSNDPFAAIDNSNVGVTSHVEPFRLFEDLERQHFNKVGNEEYLKEKAHKEQLQKKRDGVADWSLGEGSYENTKSKPWYEMIGKPPPTSSSSGSIATSIGLSMSGLPSASSSSSSSKEPVYVKLEPGTFTGASRNRPKLDKHDRELFRKQQADPMDKILKPNLHDYTAVKRIKLEHAPEAILQQQHVQNSHGHGLTSSNFASNFAFNADLVGSISSISKHKDAAEIGHMESKEGEKETHHSEENRGEKRESKGEHKRHKKHKEDKDKKKHKRK